MNSCSVTLPACTVYRGAASAPLSRWPSAWAAPSGAASRASSGVVVVLSGAVCVPPLAFTHSSAACSGVPGTASSGTTRKSVAPAMRYSSRGATATSPGPPLPSCTATRKVWKGSRSVRG